MARLKRRATADIAIFGIAGVGIVLMLYATAQGAGTSPDSVGYIRNARALAAGNGAVSAQFPPLFPALLGLIAQLGIAPLERGAGTQRPALRRKYRAGWRGLAHVLPEPGLARRRGGAAHAHHPGLDGNSRHGMERTTLLISFAHLPDLTGALARKAPRISVAGFCGRCGARPANTLRRPRIGADRRARHPLARRPTLATPGGVGACMEYALPDTAHRLALALPDRYRADARAAPAGHQPPSADADHNDRLVTGARIYRRRLARSHPGGHFRMGGAYLYLARSIRAIHAARAHPAQAPGSVHPGLYRHTGAFDHLFRRQHTAR